MFINENSIIINNVNMAPYITEAKYGYNKLWADDSGRNLAGTMSGTLVGIFPKITITFRRLTKSEMEIIAPILDSARQTVSYYDPNKQRQVSMQTYTGDYEITNQQKIDEYRKNNSFTCSFVSVKKR